MPIDVAAAVIANRALSSDYNVLTLAAPAIAAAAAPGQFVMIKTGSRRDPLLRRPFSVFEIARDSGGVATPGPLFTKSNRHLPPPPVRGAPRPNEPGPRPPPPPPPAPPP